MVFLDNQRKFLDRFASRNLYAITLVVVGVAAGMVLLQVPGSSPDDSRVSEFNRNDLMFMNMMVVHHDQAIEMAELAGNRTDSEKILQLADNISEAQRAENKQMNEWMQSMGYQPGNHHRMAGMASPEEMQRLETSEGSKFDRLFAELMIEHHRGGIEMARNFREVGKHSELKEMQTQMIETQQMEIEKMQKWQNQGF